MKKMMRSMILTMTQALIPEIQVNKGEDGKKTTIGKNELVESANPTGV